MDQQPGHVESSHLRRCKADDGMTMDDLERLEESAKAWFDRV